MKSSLSQLPNKYDLVKDTLVLILAGGRGSRLHELTDKRAKPALYFGGNRRIIDFALSNCINSGLNRIGVVTQYAPILCCAICKKAGRSYRRNAANLSICCRRVSKLTIPPGIAARRTRCIKIWRLSAITINRNTS